jgi:hypothetical protein
VLGQVPDAVGVPLRQGQLLLQGPRSEGDQTDVAVELVIRHRQTSLFVPSPVALAHDLGLDVAVLAVELRGDFRPGNWRGPVTEAGRRGLISDCC